jgi:hypothetical protein
VLWLKLKQLELLYLAARFEQLVLWMVNAVVGRHSTSKRWTSEVATSNVVIVVATEIATTLRIKGEVEWRPQWPPRRSTLRSPLHSVMNEKRSGDLKWSPPRSPLRSVMKEKQSGYLNGELRSAFHGYVLYWLVVIYDPHHSEL